MKFSNKFFELIYRFLLLFLPMLVLDSRWVVSYRIGSHYDGSTRLRISNDLIRQEYIGSNDGHNEKKLRKNYFDDQRFRLNCSVPICDGELSEIYCTGSLVFASWYFGFHEICPGPKMRFPPKVVIQNFNSLELPIRRDDFKQFCEDNFEIVPYLRTAVLTDWNRNPSTFQQIQNLKMKKFAIKLHEIWKDLSREFTSDVLLNKDRYPVLSVPYRFIVPGGSFGIYFYWDSYWIMKGLLFSELYETALAILQNFAHIVDTHGFIPNAGHIELSSRSQPPLFLQMVADYHAELQRNAVSDHLQILFLKKFLPSVEKELQWWLINRTVVVTKNAKQYQLYQFRVKSTCPRPENFLQDYDLGIQNRFSNSKFYWSSTASACESGYDFSTRWFAKGVANVTGMQTNIVIPVDLNVYQAQNFQMLSTLFENHLNNKEKAQLYAEKAKNLREAIDEVLLDKELGVWFDYDLSAQNLRRNFYPTNIFPLLLNQTKPAQCKKILKYLNDLKIFSFKEVTIPGGVPSSLAEDSREQWDYPNTWAPHNHLFVKSLLSCDLPKAKMKARLIADMFLSTVYNGLFYPVEGIPAQVWEKYDVRFDTGISGFGGEYPVQTGFGWTNGVVLDFIRLFYTK